MLGVPFMYCSLLGSSSIIILHNAHGSLFVSGHNSVTGNHQHDGGSTHFLAPRFSFADTNTLGEFNNTARPLMEGTVRTQSWIDTFLL